jgi:tetratricopeptide (TPR) repeat protein
MNYLMESQRYYAVALELCEAQNDLLGLAIVNRHLAINYKLLGDFDRSLAHLRAAQTLDHQLGHKFNEASTFTNLGSLYLTLRHDHDQAIEYYKRALTLSQESHKVHEEGHVLLNLARAYALKGAYTDAFDYVNRGLATVQRVHQIINIVRGLSYRGILYLIHLKDSEKALADYQECLRLGGGEPRTRWIIHYNMGNILHYRNQHEAAFKHTRPPCKPLKRQ